MFSIVSRELGMSDGVAVRQSGIEDYLDVDGLIDLPPGSTLLSNFERNIAEFGSTAAYRYLDFTRDDDGVAVELSWDELNIRMRAIGARLQQVTAPGTGWRFWRRRAWIM
ncbi:long-chain-fatty-acid--AMP ligase FadD32 domain protein [Mycobacteroides abscessus subsp. bolletii 1513]|uniref:Long-chain-fatty-acid--AMP ligase FadD32 domain protein n=1 Tax=Mycobacteroides abscessus subsp. bolletii 1513 TaxID=1299321 RepID=X8DUG7_9MYCO|nr:long-chain-fatty-acid--AMP ligase FadD32 domain protein [Mycobacteroides abscessus subsp. bolletii 1513]